MTEPLLALDSVSVATRGAAALDRISLTVGAGEVVALLGANGAGKSTVLKSVMGLLPSSGGIRLGGVEINRLSPTRRARLGLGYVPEGRRLFPGMSVRDTLLVGSRTGRRGAAERLSDVLEMFPDLRAAPRHSGLATLRRPTADAGDRPRAHGRTQAPAAR